MLIIVRKAVLMAAWIYLHTKYLPLKHRIKDSDLAQWVGDNASFTLELTKDIVEAIENIEAKCSEGSPLPHG